MRLGWPLVGLIEIAGHVEGIDGVGVRLLRWLAEVSARAGFLNSMSFRECDRAMGLIR